MIIAFFIKLLSYCNHISSVMSRLPLRVSVCFFLFFHRVSYAHFVIIPYAFFADQSYVKLFVKLRYRNIETVNFFSGNSICCRLNQLSSVFFCIFCNTIEQVLDILGLKEDNASNAEREAAFGKVVDMLLEERMKAKANKDWATSDKIRNELTALGFEIKDGKDGCEWKLNK